MESACGFFYSLSLSQRGGGRRLRRFKYPLYHRITMLFKPHYSRSVKLAIPRSVARGCGVIVLAAVQSNRQPYCAAGEIENIGANGVLTAKRVASKTAVAQ